LVQGAAVWPGLSRSASTISTALFLGWTWEEAGRLSFVMAIPAIIGATLLTAKDIAGLPDLTAVAAGIIVSFVVGLAALGFLMRFLKARKLWPFAVYTSLMAIYAFMK
jgi:undecaprenyl-diphosphatase